MSFFFFFFCFPPLWALSLPPLFRRTTSQERSLARKEERTKEKKTYPLGTIERVDGRDRGVCGRDEHAGRLRDRSGWGHSNELRLHVHSLGLHVDSNRSDVEETGLF